MLRTRLLTATAAVALFAAPAAFAQDPTAPATPPTAPTDPAVEATEVQPQNPPQAQTMTAPAAAVAPMAQDTAATANTVVDVLRSNGQFTTLLAALEAAQLTETLSTRPAISIFAPTDAAFAALPEAERTRLMDPANVNELRQILLYHVIVADVQSSQIEGARGPVETAARTQVQLDGTGDAIKVDEATVVQADIDASNGAVFAIDRVLTPAASQVASGDAEEAAVPADETTTDADAMTEAPAATETETAPATATPPAEVAAPPPTPADAAPAPMESPAPATATTTPAQTTVTAPNGQPATSVTTTASPPVVNPTDGQQDQPATPDEDEALAEPVPPGA